MKLVVILLMIGLVISTSVYLLKKSSCDGICGQDDLAFPNPLCSSDCDEKNFICHSDSECVNQDGMGCVNTRDDRRGTCGSACMTGAGWQWRLGNECKCVNEKCENFQNIQKACEDLCKFADRKGCDYVGFSIYGVLVEELKYFNCTQCCTGFLE